MPSLAEVGMRNRLAAGDKPWRAAWESAQVCTFVWTWAHTTRKLGRPPTQVEYAKEWSTTDRTVRRDIKRFERCFPGADLDQVVAELNVGAKAKAEDWLVDRSRSLGVSAPLAALGVAVT